MERTSWYLSLLLAAALLPARVPAEEKSAVDSDFLEFLGSLDSDDAAWSAYLQHADPPPAGAVKPTNAPKPVKPAEKAVPEGEEK
ncbi:MAG TPA: hypothetical protein VKB41_10100 [Steroidobacteraceae bacterium]|jgi:hypothetical protein|nr:hypothetical protein [Steroidobacteraceae bacterium]